MYFSSMSLTCGRWPLPQQVWKRTCSVGMPRRAWLMISTLLARKLRYCSHGPVGIEHPGRAELGFVDLDDQAGIGDRLVFLVAGIGDGYHVLLFAGVVLVADAGAETERAERREISFGVLAGDGRLEICDIGLHRRLTGIADRSGANSSLLVGPVMRVPGHRESRADRTAGACVPQAGLVEAGELATVAFAWACALRRAGDRVGAAGETGDAVLQIAAIAAGLGIFPVVDHIDAKLDLALSNFVHSLGRRDV